MRASKPKIALLLSLSLSLLACRFLFPEPAAPVSLPPSQQPKATVAKSANTPTSTSTEPAVSQATAPELITVALDPKDGSLKEQLLSHAQKAAEMGMLPVVEFDATW
ncbi:MAG: hypothetical protein L6461_10760 [Anaerolineae bacterium]|nr:hypothetical protein [Anaerolineae bacterium]